MSLSSQSTIVAAGARALVRQCDRAILSTAQADEGGWPYGSLVMTACDYEGKPIMLLSDLAEHSKNLSQDVRASLLFDATDGLENPLTGARVTVMGRAVLTKTLTDRERYLARHPSSAVYVDFADFKFYSVEVTRVHQVAGFGKIDWISAEAFLCGTSRMTEFAAVEAQIIEKLNRESMDKESLYGSVSLVLAGDDWSFTGIDPEGCDLRAGSRVRRILFDKPVTDLASTLDALKELAGRTTTA